MTKSQEIKIPEDATLKDVISWLNTFEMTVNPDSKHRDFQKWLYEHRHWILNNDDD